LSEQQQVQARAGEAVFNIDIPRPLDDGEESHRVKIFLVAEAKQRAANRTANKQNKSTRH
jgi:hypothetical protein